MQAAIGYVAPAAQAYEKNPIWTADPKHTPYPRRHEEHAPVGYAGKLGYASAARDRPTSSSRHGGRGGQRLEVAEGSGRARRRSAPSATTRSDAARSGGRAPAALPPARPPHGVGADGPSPSEPRSRRAVRAGLLERLQNNRNALGLLFMLPAAVLLLLFLTYPLGLGVWLGFTDAKIGRAGRLHRPRELRVPVATTRSLGSRCSTRSSTRSSRASLKFGLGLWLALLLNQQPAVQGLLPRRRPAALHRADGAVGDRLLVDLRRAVLDHQLGAAARWA